MDILIGILVAFVAVVIIVVAVGRKVVGKGVDPTQLTFDPSVMADVHALARAGRKVQAVALLRQANPDLSVLVATAMVEKMVLRKPGPLGPSTAENGSGPLPPPAPADAPAPATALPDVPLTAAPAQWTDDAPSASVVPFEVELEARNLKAQGRDDDAVDLLRADAGFAAAEAREFVRGL